MKRLLDAARALDRDDDLRGFREYFWIPPFGESGSQSYFCGHSLGLQPRTAAAAVENEMRAWRERAVAGHFRGDPAWMDFGDRLAEGMARVVGAHADEVTVMNTLTVNLHLLMVSFYRPAGRRRKIVIESHAFPSDRYAVASQLRYHGFDPDECMVELAPEPGSRLIEESRVESWLARHGDEVALVLWPGVQYASGQAFDLGRIAAAGRAAGAYVGLDLAHAAGNIPLSLHDTGADFATWCTYKYLNAGPGAVAACFVHRRHSGDGPLPRFEGWWGNARGSRFQMAAQFAPAAGAEAWQLSNPPILSMAPLQASLEIFEDAGLGRLRAKSLAMTGWLGDSIEAHFDDVLEILTPKDPGRRGCQLSLRVRAGREQGRRLFRHLEDHGVIADWREPDIVRVAPVPLYNRYQDCFEMLSLANDWAAAIR
jgi:kynureninase